MEAGHSSTQGRKKPTKLLNRIYFKLASKDRTEAIWKYKKVYGNAFSNDVLYSAYLTGLHPKTIVELDTVEFLELPQLDRATILSELHKFYLTKYSIPTTKELFNALHGKIAPDMTIDDLRKQLILMDFVWKKIPNYTFVVMERPEVTNERYKYLKRLCEYHEQRKCIYFIDNIEFDKFPVVTCEKKKVMYAFSESNILFQSVVDYNAEEAKKFISLTVLCSVAKETVLVLRNHSHYCERFQSRPTLDSLKCDLTEWLDRHKIPYTDDMAKAELYSLVQKCTNVDGSTYVLDNIALASGHTVLRIPEHIEMLTPTVLFNNYIEDNLAKESEPIKMFQPIFGNVTKETMQTIFDCVMVEKKKLLKNDVDVDNLWDKLVTLMEHKNADWLHDSDVPSLSDSD